MLRPLAACALLSGALALAPAALAAAEAPPPASLADCDARVAADPSSFDAWRCFWDLARRTKSHAQVEAHLETILARQPDNNRARLQLGAVSGDLFKDQAEGLFRQAAEGFEAAGELRGAVYARGGLAYFYRARGRRDEAAAQQKLILALAQRLGAPDVIAEAIIERGWLEFERADYGSSYVTLKQVLLQEDLRPWPYLRSRALQGLAAASWGLGRFEEAMTAYQEQAAMQHERGLLFAEAATRVNIAMAAGSAGIGTRESRRQLAEEALRIAQLSGNRNSEASAHIYIGNSSEMPDAGVHYEEALRIHRQTKVANDIVLDLERVSWSRNDGTPAGTRASAAALDEAIGMARRNGLAQRYVVGLSLRAKRRWETGPRAQAIAASLEAVEAAESLRSKQLDDTARASGFALVHVPYYDLGWHLLQPLGPAVSPADLQLSFETMERMRARRLLELMESAGAPESGGGAAPLHEQRDAITRDISAVQKKLLDRATSEADRDAALAQLERLELHEREVRLQIARQDPVFAALRAPAIPDLAQVRAQMGEHEALLSYQIIAPMTADSPAWALVVTRTAARVVPLQLPSDLERRIAFFSGALNPEDPAQPRLAASLHSQILAPALAVVPEGITRLVIIPDGPLHSLAFAALRAEAAAEPAGSRYAISVAPSVTVWMRWRGRAAVPPATLALADPSGVPLPALPYARREAAAVSRRMGAGSELLIGPGASEEMLRARDLGSFGVLHLAAHAIINDDRPERSGVLLAGGAVQDGLMQSREIAALRLPGRLVVLSACRGAAGKALIGEGVMGLAHAFFQAGARAVVGSLWPVRDDQAAVLLEQFYTGLSDGLAADEALSRAQQETMRLGLPAGVWAGFQLMGDGSIAFARPQAPAPAGSRRPGLLLASLACGAGALLLAGSARRG